MREKLLAQIDEKRREYAALGVKNLDRALARDVEHVDADTSHGAFSSDVIREYADTPELQDAVREAFVLNLQGRGSNQDW